MMDPDGRRWMVIVSRQAAQAGPDTRRARRKSQGTAPIFPERKIGAVPDFLHFNEADGVLCAVHPRGRIIRARINSAAPRTPRRIIRIFFSRACRESGESPFICLVLGARRLCARSRVFNR